MSLLGLKSSKLGQFLPMLLKSSLRRYQRTISRFASLENNLFYWEDFCIVTRTRRTEAPNSEVFLALFERKI